MIMRRQPFILHHALRWGDTHPFLTSIVPIDRDHLEADAAMVEIVAYTTIRTKDTIGENGWPVRGGTIRVTLSTVLMGKYVHYEWEDIHAESEAAHVLVIREPIELKEGDLVTIREGLTRGTYHVRVAHQLDSYKSEYKTAWRRDV